MFTCDKTFNKNALITGVLSGLLCIVTKLSCQRLFVLKEPGGMRMFPIVTFIQLIHTRERGSIPIYPVL